VADQGTVKTETKVVVEKLNVPAVKIESEQPKVVVIKESAKVVEKAVEDPNAAKEDIWMYHKDYEPKLFKKGEPITEGYVLKNTFGWERDPKNNFIWKKK